MEQEIIMNQYLILRPFHFRQSSSYLFYLLMKGSLDDFRTNNKKAVSVKQQRFLHDSSLEKKNKLFDKVNVCEASVEYRISNL